MSLDRANTPAGEEYATVYVAFELSKAKWRLGIILPERPIVAGARQGGGLWQAGSDSVVLRGGLRRSLAAPLADGRGGDLTRSIRRVSR